VSIGVVCEARYRQHGAMLAGTADIMQNNTFPVAATVSQAIRSIRQRLQRITLIRGRDGRLPA